MKVLFVFAHPDDETFATGGTIAKLVKGGHKVSLITATYGQAGQIGKYKATPEELGEIRKLELEEAARILGISKIHYLGLMDGELTKHRVTKLARMILPLIKDENPDVVITFDKHGASNHPDHIRVSYAATHAFKGYMDKSKKHVKLYHTVVPRSYLKIFEEVGLSMQAFGKPKGIHDNQITTKVDISDTFDIKNRAALAHKSQTEDWDRFLKRIKHADLKVEFFKLVAERGIL